MEEAPMAIPSSCRTLRLPPGFLNLLEGLAREVIRAQPLDVVTFAAQHFQQLLQQREDGSVDPVAQGALMEDQPLCQEPKEAKEKEAKDREEEEQAGSRAATHRVSGTVPAPKTRPAQPNTGTQQHPQTLLGCNKEGQTHGVCVWRITPCRYWY
ncbi:sperm surface protein Sp17 [Pogoniulus pusillus]|uniref:sperm surface protein Sp17 n=1 Tax=Pogoniulus pusillus TaxID=488313 RepID=UPI0030B942A3